MTAIGAAVDRTFQSLQVRNYRFYFFGQIVSVSGTWMQSVAQAWLVLRLSHSGIALGFVTALQFLPMLLFGPWGGLVADRFEKRRLLLVTQSSGAMLAVVLGVLIASGEVRLWMVYVLATCLGLVTMIDNPTRQAFVQEMVGAHHVRNAVSLNSVVMNSARLIGPALAGVLISTVGLAVCFFANAASYSVVVICLLLMRRHELHDPVVVPRAKGQLAEGFRYVWATRGLRDPLLMMVVLGTLAYEFQVTLALLAKQTFHGGAGTFGAMLSAMSAGAVVGGLGVAARGGHGTRTLARVGMVFGALVLAVALAPSLPSTFALLPIMGAASIAFIAMSNATLQLRAAPEMRGRVMALFGVAFLGSTPIGAPIAGAVAETFGPRAAIAMGGIAAIVTCAVFVAFRSERRVSSERSAPGTQPLERPRQAESAKAATTDAGRTKTAIRPWWASAAASTSTTATVSVSSGVSPTRNSHQKRPKAASARPTLTAEPSRREPPPGTPPSHRP